MEKEQTNENSWEFHLTDKIAQLSKMTLEMHTEFGLVHSRHGFMAIKHPKSIKRRFGGGR